VEHTKWILPSSLNFLYTHESGIEPVTICLGGPKSYDILVLVKQSIKTVTTNMLESIQKVKIYKMKSE
jgi:hypothetical protein